MIPHSTGALAFRANPNARPANPNDTGWREPAGLAIATRGLESTAWAPVVLFGDADLHNLGSLHDLDAAYVATCNLLDALLEDLFQDLESPPAHHATWEETGHGAKPGASCREDDDLAEAQPEGEPTGTADADADAASWAKPGFAREDEPELHTEVAGEPDHGPGWTLADGLCAEGLPTDVEETDDLQTRDLPSAAPQLAEGDTDDGDLDAVEGQPHAPAREGMPPEESVIGGPGGPRRRASVEPQPTAAAALADAGEPPRQPPMVVYR